MAKDSPGAAPLSTRPRGAWPAGRPEIGYPPPVGSSARRLARWAGRALFAVALVEAGVTPVSAQVIVRKAGSGPAAQLAQALSTLLGRVPQAAPRVVELTGDTLADTARIARESKGQAVVYAIGPDATEVAAEARGTAVVSLSVPNPARVRTPGTYVSVYPRLEGVLGFVKGDLKGRQAGLLFSPAKNREVALAFMKAAEGQGVTVVPITVSSSGDLTRELKSALPRIDVLLLAVDPILFDPQNLEYIVSETRAAGKPTVGFLEEMTRLGVTVGLVPSAEAQATVAVDAAREPVLVGKRRVEVVEATVVVSRRAAEALKLDPEAIGAQRIQ